MMGSRNDMRWEHREWKPILKIIPLFAFGIWGLFTVVIYIMVRGTAFERSFWPGVFWIGIPMVIIILLSRYLMSRIRDDLNRFYETSFEEASAKIHHALTEADVRYTHFSAAEYDKGGSIDSLRIAGHLRRKPSSVFEMYGPSAVILEQKKNPKGYCEVCLYPYEGEMMPFLDGIKEIIDGAFTQ